MPCVIKYQWDDGKELPANEQPLWCDKVRTGFDWCFVDAQHAALADKPVCNKCRGNIIKALRGNHAHKGSNDKR